MKTENEIAKENVEKAKKIFQVGHLDEDLVCETHFTSCQREEEFLINILKDFSDIGISGYECDELCKYKYSFIGTANKRIKDLQNAIKIYEKVGVK